MLEYEPLWLHKFHQDTKEAGIKCNLAQVFCLVLLRDFPISTFSVFFSGATIFGSPLHLFPHRDKKAKQTKVTQEKEVTSEEEDSKEKVAKKEKAPRGGPFCDSSEKSTNSSNLIKIKEKMPHHPINFQSNMAVCAN